MTISALRPLALAALFAAALPQHTASAQDASAPGATPGAAPNAGASSEARPTMDAGARQALEASVAAYRALRSLSLTSNVRMESGGRANEVKDVEVSWKKPSSLRVEATAAGEERRIFITPASLTEARTAKGRTRWARQSREDGEPAMWMEMALLAAEPTSLGLWPMLGEGRPFGALRPLLRSASLRTSSAEEAAALGAECDVVTGTFNSPRLGEVTVEYFIARSDRLLRRVSASGERVGSVTSTFSNVQANAALPDATFRFVAAAGAEQVDDLDPNYDPRLKRGARPFAFQAKDLQGKSVSLDSYKGKVWLLDFWATWCPPCVESAPAIASAYAKHRSKGFDVLGISLDQSGTALRQFTARNRMPWRQVFDGKGWQGPLVAKYGVRGIPFSLLIGRDGRIIAVDPDADKLDALVSKALKQK